MPKKKKDQDEGYVSDSTCDKPPREEKEDENLEEAPAG